MPDVFSAVHAIALHLQALRDYDKEAVASLLAELADDPGHYEAVADGLTSLRLGATVSSKKEGGE